MRFLHSIGWRLQLWHAALLALVLAGFGGTAWRLERATQFRQVDQELERRVAVVADTLRPEGAPRCLPPEPPPPGAEPGAPRPPRPGRPCPEKKQTLCISAEEDCSVGIVGIRNPADLDLYHSLSGIPLIIVNLRPLLQAA